MPMLLITDEQLNHELGKISSGDSLITEPKIINIVHGRGSQREIPSGLRQLIAEESINGAPAQALADAFNVSKSSISAYKNGATSTASYNKPDETLAKANDEVRDKISDAARDKLMSALESLTKEKVSLAKARDIAGIAKDMSVIVKNMEPNVPVNEGNKTQVVIFRPRTKDEDEYDVITVNE